MDQTPVNAVPQNGNPVQTTTVVANKKGGSKVWIIVLVVFLVLCCLCGSIFGGLYWIGKTADSDGDGVIDSQQTVLQDLEDEINNVIDGSSTDSDDSSSEDIDTTGLNKVDNSNYTFYYPSTYKYVADSTGTLLEQYQNPNANTLGGNNNINLTSSVLSSSSSDLTESDCDDMVYGTNDDGLVNTYATEFGIDASAVSVDWSESFENNGVQGCSVGFELDFGTKGILYMDQNLYYKKGVNRLYVVTVTYDELDTEEESLLTNSQELFLLK